MKAVKQVVEGLVQTTEDVAFRGTQCSKEEANTCCWGYKTMKGPLERLYFKLPALGDHEVRIKVLNTGLCHSDVSKLLGEWGNTKLYPLVPGHEIIAEVEKIGAKVTHVKVGDIVAHGIFRRCCYCCELCRKGDDQLCLNLDPFTYDPYLGGYSTHMHVQEDFLFKVPPKLDIKKAPPLMCAGVTVFAPLKKFGKPGYRCGVVGIGGLGHLAIQMANKMGMHVVAISTNPTKEKDCLALGAKEFILSKSELAMKLLYKNELDIVINTSFDNKIAPYMQALKHGGMFIQAGVPPKDRPFELNSTDLIFGQKNFYGTNGGNRMEVEQTLNFCEENNILPVVESYKWSEFDSAFKKIYDETARYRCVVNVAETFDDK